MIAPALSRRARAITHAGAFKTALDSGKTAERAGNWDRALEEYEAAFSLVTVEGDARSAADLLRWIGTIHRERGDLELATDLYEASLAIAEANNLPDTTAAVLNCLAIVEQYRGNLERAEKLYGEARAVADRIGDVSFIAMVDQNLGILCNIRGDVVGALRFYQSALQVQRALGGSEMVLRCLNNIGMAYVDLEEWHNAEVAFDQAFEIADRLRDTTMLGHLGLNRAELAVKQGKFERARSSCDVAFEIFARLDSLSGQAEAHKFYGILYRDLGQTHLAQVHLGLAIDLACRCEDKLLEAESHAELALANLALGRSREALRCLNRAHRIFTDLNARRDATNIDGRLDQLESTFLNVTKAWGESIESKDAYTAGHCERVADYACRLAALTGLSGRDLNWFRMGAFLHDVGKVDVPVEVLNKPGKLSREERVTIEAHTTAGHRIVSELDFPWDIAPMVRSHHEHWDGTGYPDGLAGEEIPLVARVLCIADVFDALTTTRSYRPALPADEALRIMQRESGRLFDPKLLARFVDLLAAQAASRPTSLWDSVSRSNQRPGQKENGSAHGRGSRF
jgi:putative nucleotidyltransferase with HDIG domain